jgi:hypothetical protein
MFLPALNRFCTLCVGILCLGAPIASAASQASWNGLLSDGSGKPVAAAVIKLHSVAGGRDYTTTTASNGRFRFAEIIAGRYEVSVKLTAKEWKAGSPLLVKDADLTMALQMSALGQELRISSSGGEGSAQASGGEHLSSAEVSSLPLNARDFSKLLLLAAGTMTDANGAANFTQQFAVNGQRGAATVFAMDGFDTTDPEMGGGDVFQFQCGCDSGSTGQFRFDAGRDRTRGGKLYQRGDEVGSQPDSWQSFRVRAQRGIRRAQLF